MTDPKATLNTLHKNLNILKLRQAKHAGNVPLDLLNQIEDHETAITLTRQVITGEISEADWEEALKPLLVSLRQAQTYLDQSGQTVAGDQYNVEGDLKQQTFTGPLLQIVQQVGFELPAYNLVGQLAILEQAWPHLDPASKATAQVTLDKLRQAIDDLSTYEQQYRERLKAHYAGGRPLLHPPGRRDQRDSAPSDRHPALPAPAQTAGPGRVSRVGPGRSGDQAGQAQHPAGGGG